MKLQLATLAGLAGLSLAAGLTLAAGPASAATACTGASCSEGASVSVVAVITETITPGSFSFGGGQPVPAGTTTGPTMVKTSNQSCPGVISAGPPGGNTPLCPDYTVSVTTGDSAGYVIMGSATDLSNGKGASIPAADMSAATLTGNGAGGTFQPFSNTPAVFVTAGGASSLAGDNYSVADSLIVPAGASGSYADTITFGAVAS